MLFGLIPDGSDAYSGYEADTSGLDKAQAGYSKWATMQDGTTDVGKLRLKENEKLRLEQEAKLKQQSDSNLNTSSSLNKMFGGNSLTEQSLQRGSDVQSGNMLANNADSFSRMADSIEANDMETQTDRVRDIAVNVDPSIELKKADLINKVALAKSGAAAGDNAASKKLGSTVGAVAGSAFGPLGTVAGGMLGGMLG